VVTLAELRFGIELIPEPSRRLALNQWLAHKVRPMFRGRVLEITEDIMLKWRLGIEPTMTERVRLCSTHGRPESFRPAPIMKRN